MTRHILVAVGTGYSKAALALGIERARECNARLTALHVVDRLPGWASASIDGDCGGTFAYIEQHANDVAQASLKTIRDAGIQGAIVTIDLPRNLSLSQVIARAARELNADLIVIGRSKGAGWRFWEERVSNALSRYSNRRVLIASDDAVRAETKATPLSYIIVNLTQHLRSISLEKDSARWSIVAYGSKVLSPVRASR